MVIWDGKKKRMAIVGGNGGKLVEHQDRIRIPGTLVVKKVKKTVRNAEDEESTLASGGGNGGKLGEVISEKESEDGMGVSENVEKTKKTIKKKIRLRQQ